MRSDNFWLIWITLLAIVMRLGRLYFDPLFWRDCILYIQMAQQWFERGSYIGVLDCDRNASWIPPMSIFLIQALMHIGVSVEVAARLLTIIFGCSIPIIGYLISKVICRNRYIALCSALFFAVNPVLVDYSIQPTREVFYLVWCGLTLLFICKGIRYRNEKNWISSGCFCAVASLTRYESFELLIYVILYFSIATFIMKQYTFVMALKHCMLFFLAFFGVFILISFLSGTYRVIYDNYYSYLSNSDKIKAIRVIYR